MDAGHSIWAITPEERGKHDKQFDTLLPTLGYLSGDQTRRFFLQSGLPASVLAEIWALADMNKDGKMDRLEFSIAMKLIKLKLLGQGLPSALPIVMKQAPARPPVASTCSGMGSMPNLSLMATTPMLPAMPAATSMNSMIPLNAMTPVGPTSPLPSLIVPALTNGTPGIFQPSSVALALNLPHSSSLSSSPLGFTNTGMTKARSLLDLESSSSNSSSNNSPVRISQKTGCSDWAVPQSSRLKYRLQFNSLDKQMTGYLSGPQVRNTLITSNLTQTQLATIWNLADFDKDGKLTADEFILAMHLVDVAKMGQPLPLALPRDLVPPSVRGNLADKANGTIPSICVGRYEEFEAEPPQKTKINVKFEDKRKENLDRGNAELEHRRQALQEQQQKEEERRARETQEERERLEREARQVEERRQQEREQRQQRQREAERQKVEERQKELERKEAAKQELERRRKLEWEQRKLQELQRLRNQEQEEVLQLKARKKSLELELEAVDDKHKQISDRLRDARSKKKIQKGELDMVNQDRDRHSMEISTLQQQFEDYQKKLVLLVPEHQRLRERLGNLASNNLPSSTMTVLQGGVMEKEITCRKLKEQLDALEKETTLKLFVMQEYNKDIKFEDMDDSVLQSLLSLLGCLSKLFYLIKDLRASQRKQQSALDKLYKIKEDKLWNLQRGRGREEETLRRAKLEEDWQWQQKLSREEESRQRRLQEEREARLREEEREEQEQEALDLLRARGEGDREADGEERKRKEESNGVKEEEETRETERADERKLHVLRFSLGEEEEETRETERADERKLHILRFSLGEEDERRRKEQGDKDEISARPSEPGAWPQQDCTKSEIHEQRLGGPDRQTGALHPVAPAHGKPATLNSYRGLYPFTARNADELTFAADDLIEVEEMTVGGPGWLYGSCRGGIGWFPNSYVEKRAVSEASTVELAQMPQAISSTSITHGTEEVAGIPLTGHSDSSVEGHGPAFKPTHVTVSTSAEHGQEVGSVQAQTLCSWNVKKDGHLNFSKDDVITVLEQQENWWLGELNGDQGWFPKSYVSLVTGNGAPSGSMCSYPDGCDSMETAQPEEYVALYTYESPEAVALTFSEGNTILVTEKNGEWWRGCIGDRSGAFPASYVKPKEDNSSGYASRPGAPGKRPEIALVVTGYTAAGTEQLSLSPGQHVLLLTKNPTGWWLGELQARGKKRKTGLFPASHVKILGPSSGMSSPVPVPICQVTAMYDYTPASEVEISFSKGQLINVLENNDPDWWKGETNGTTGLFPSNYVKMTTNESDPSQQWCADLMSLEAMSPAEKKRQDYIHELIETEERYVEDLQLVLEVFHKPMSESGRLTDEELDMIFVNWKELIVSNTKLLKALRGRKKTCGERRQVQMIGDILAAELSHMQAYVGFCSCQLNGASLLQLKTDQEADFKDFLKKLATDHRCKGMPLSSFLLKPMQRITRYPLIIKNLLESTPETHLDHGQLQEALVKAEELCFQVNEGVREKENAERLEWIQTHVQCEGITENLIFNSLTNCLGPRKLLHSGKLYKTKSHKELHAFLFNDFLLFTQATKQVSSSGPDKLFSSKSNIQFKLYKTPVFLNEVLVKLPSEPCNDEAVFLISHIDRVYSLKTENINERTAWVQKIKTASEDFIETEKKKREKAYHARSLKSSGIGRLLVTIREATELKSSKPNGKSNPYCEVTMGEQGYTSRTLSDTLNPKWNFNCQFFITDLYQDVLSITIFERDQFSPDEFLGRTEVPVATIKKEFENRGPSDRQLLLHEVPTGEVWVRLDLQLFDQDTVR